MASINGLELKDVQNFFGHEGECYQGNLYLNGEKIGIWSQDGWGGPDEYWFESGLHINEGKFRLLVEENLHPIKYYGRKLTMNLDILMAKILSLNDREKSFNQYQKTKFPVLVIMEMNDGTEYWNHVKSENSDDDIKMMEKNFLKTTKNNSSISEIYIYRQPEDFNIGEPFKMEDLIA